MPQSSLYYVLGIVLLLALMAGSFLYVYLSSASQEIKKEWKSLLNMLRLRLDKIPALLEAMKSDTKGQETMIGEMIVLRDKNWEISNLTAEKNQLEHLIFEKLSQFFEMKKNFPELSRNIAFLSAEKELKVLEIDIKKMADQYNGKAEKYNKFINFILVKPAALLLGFKKVLLFEGNDRNQK